MKKSALICQKKVILILNHYSKTGRALYNIISPDLIIYYGFFSLLSLAFLSFINQYVTKMIPNMGKAEIKIYGKTARKIDGSKIFILV